MTLFEKSLQTLELPAVLALLAAECTSPAAKENALSLRPATELFEARYLVDETTAARTMSQVRGLPSFSGVRDVRSAVRRAEIGGALNTVELTDVASVLRAADGALSYRNADRSEGTVIDSMFYALRANRFLETKISTAVVGEDEISDAASTELASIRRHMRVAGDKIRTQLNKIITSPTYQKALMDPIITIRNDRYVVPVKAEQKSALPGLVHDVSGSGSTLFIEPMGVVQTNNEIRELLAKEKKEIERILAELSADVAAHADDIAADVETLTALDLIFAKAKLSMKLDAHAPEFTDENSDRNDVYLRRCRHPLLERGKTVPVDIRLGGAFDTLVITGPNTGGKTVALKTIGLLCAMAQCGLHIPAESDARLPVFSRIFADIGDEQSIEQSLSTFSSHMTNIVRILKAVSGEGDDEDYDDGGRKLLLFDELGAGTDPVEGAALAIAVIEYARARGALTAATTHYSELKTYALNVSGVENASCEFDVNTLKPTYRLLIGVPGKSNAFAISRRLGLPESVIARASENITGETRNFEDAVGRLEAARRDAENERDEAYKLRTDAARDARIVEQYRSQLERERENASTKARRDAQRLVDSARGEISAIFDELNDLRRAAEEDQDFTRLNEAKAEAFRRLNAQDDAIHTRRSYEDTEIPENTREIVAGDRVKLLKFDTEADVITAHGDSLELQAGIMKITAKRAEVRLIESKKKPSPQSAVSVTRANTEAVVRPEIDVRGNTVDDALAAIELYLDAARLAHLESVRIIHGKGTGALRSAVHEMLRRERVQGFRLGKYGEGEIGVTVVTL
ncbi:MAG: endonuclease MutS2 [Oscillospiraceae bacterium]|jgi:DNA mismatch repair protein MutS2|nr:endonuclease MutS2 [Oscillospiraceae bacterium]